MVDGYFYPSISFHLSAGSLRLSDPFTGILLYIEDKGARERAVTFVVVATHPARGEERDVGFDLFFRKCQSGFPVGGKK